MEYNLVSSTKILQKSASGLGVEKKVEIEEACCELKQRIEAADMCNDVSVSLKRARLVAFSTIYQKAR